LLDQPRPAGSGACIDKATVLGNNMSMLSELWRFARVRKKYWLVPIAVVMFLLGGLLIMTQGSVISPFIYALF
jgi:hypothetical protein